MAKGKFGGMGMAPNMNSLMKQAEKMQRDMQKLQEEMEEKTVEASAGGGMVTVVANGKKQVVSISIKPEAVDPEDVEMLEDLVFSAVNAALSQADELVSSEMNRVTGGMNIPGLF